MKLLPGVLLGLAALAGAVCPILTPTAASADQITAYVSHHASSGNPDTSCATARYTTINGAIHAVVAGGTVVVCPGTYRTQAVVLKPVRLEGRDALIDATGQRPVIPGLPGGSGIVVLHTHKVIVTGFVIVGAGFDGILVANSDNVQVSHNLLVHNGNVGMDFNGTSYSQAYHNISEFNGGGGFLVADDLGVNHDNVVAWNFATHNPGGCGVIVAGHSTAGVFGNVVAHNLLTYNGTLRKSPGAGVVVATEVPHETVADNTVIGNTIYGNGIAGVTIHGHLPGLHMAGNEVLDNNIGRNNTVGDTIGLAPPARGHPDLRTTGILVGSSTHIAVVISGNHIHHDYYGIYIDGLVRATFGGNHYRRVHTQVKFS
jgi:Right handed beta helix region